MPYSDLARYALWILLCVPVFVLGFGLLGDLVNSILQDNKVRKARKDAKDAKARRRDALEEEYWNSRRDGR